MDYKEKYESALEQARKELKTCCSMDCDAARQIFRFFPELRKEEKPLTSFQQCLNCILRGVYYAEVPDEKVNEFILNIVRTRTDELIKLAKKHEYTDCQLRESEDEIVRKRLIDYFESLRVGHVTTKWEGLDIQSIITYLEKQKEQIPYIDFVIKPHKGDDNNPYDMRVSEAQEYAIKRGFGVPFNDGEVYVDERHITQTIGNILRWADDHPKEQKPENGTVLKGFVAVDYCDVKTTWNPTGRRVSFFTKKPVRDLLTEIHYWASTGPYYERIKLGYECFPELKWEDEPVEVELLIYGTEQKPKQEWSEEDEKDMAHIIRILDDCYAYGKHDLSKTDHENLINKLKSLRPRWCPSEEQMSALLAILNDPNNIGSQTCQLALTDLYEHLKRMI